MRVSEARRACEGPEFFFALCCSLSFRTLLCFFFFFFAFCCCCFSLSPYRRGRTTRLRARRGSPPSLSLRSCSAWRRGPRGGEQPERECEEKKGGTMQQHLLPSSSSRAVSHASSSSSSRAPCPPCPAPPLRWQRRRDAQRPSLARKERAATLRVSLQRFRWGGVSPSVSFFLLGRRRRHFSNPFFSSTKQQNISTRQRQLFAAHPQGQRGDTLLQPVDYSVSFLNYKRGEKTREKLDQGKQSKEKKPRHHRFSRSPLCFSILHLPSSRSLLFFFRVLLR